ARDGRRAGDGCRRPPGLWCTSEEDSEHAEQPDEAPVERVERAHGPGGVADEGRQHLGNGGVTGQRGAADRLEHAVEEIAAGAVGRADAGASAEEAAAAEDAGDAAEDAGDAGDAAGAPEEAGATHDAGHPAEETAAGVAEDARAEEAGAEVAAGAAEEAAGTPGAEQAADRGEKVTGEGKGDAGQRRHGRRTAAAARAEQRGGGGRSGDQRSEGHGGGVAEDASGGLEHGKLLATRTGGPGGRDRRKPEGLPSVLRFDRVSSAPFAGARRCNSYARNARCARNVPMAKAAPLGGNHGEERDRSRRLDAAAARFRRCRAAAGGGGRP